MKSFRLSMVFLVTVFCLSGCVKDDLEQSRLCGRGAVTVKTVFPEVSSAMPVPAVTRIVSTEGEFPVPSGENTPLPAVFDPGESLLTAFTEPEGMVREGMTMSVRNLSDGSVEAHPGGFYSCRTAVDIPRNDTLRVTLSLSPRLYSLRFELPVTRGDASLIERVEGRLEGVAQRFDLEAQSLAKGFPAAVSLIFSRLQARSTSGIFYLSTSELLGIDGEAQVLTLTIRFTDGREQTIVTDITPLMQGFGHGSPLEPLVITAGLEAPEEAGMEARLTNWTVQEGEVEIR